MGFFLPFFRLQDISSPFSPEELELGVPPSPGPRRWRLLRLPPSAARGRKIFFFFLPPPYAGLLFSFFFFPGRRLINSYTIDAPALSYPDDSLPPPSSLSFRRRTPLLLRLVKNLCRAGRSFPGPRQKSFLLSFFRARDGASLFLSEAGWSRWTLAGLSAAISFFLSSAPGPFASSFFWGR